MMTLLSLVLFVALAGALAFKGVSLKVWLGSWVVLWLVLTLSGAMAWWLAIITLIGAVAMVLALIPSVRQRWISQPFMRYLNKALPPMSATEREALEAGEPWWEAQLFAGKPQWNKLLSFNYTTLTEREQQFLDNEVETVCNMVNDWKIDFELMDLPEDVWRYLRENRFFAMLIDEDHGGLGFSAYAQSAVVTKLATHSGALATTVMVPNSLGPGELLLKYGTEAQKEKWLPGLVDGSEIPCFGLTGPEVGSDATALPDTGVVCKGEFNGEQVVGVRLNFSKRWITLAPVATVIGLAFKMSDPEGLIDPERRDYGITCALVPADTQGISIGRRHYPGSSFMNGPILGQDVFIPLDYLIGGIDKAGQGWRMLVECLSAGRGISLPALSTAASQKSYRAVTAYSRIRRQFRMPIGRFEGVQEALARIAGNSYLLESCRALTASAVDHLIPSVVTTIAKYHMTEMMRSVVNDSMDIMGGRAVQQGPRNPIALGYRVIPVAITVEGANILTRSLMIFGQGAIRCHPYLLKEMEAANSRDITAFDKLLSQHIGTAVNRAGRSLVLGLFGSRWLKAPVQGPTARYFQQIEQLSSALFIASDVAMATLGGSLKRREKLSARLGDTLSHLYLASSALKHYHSEGDGDKDELLHLDWAVQHSLAEAAKGLEGFIRNHPSKGVALLLRVLIFPRGNRYQPPSDKLGGKLAEKSISQSSFRERLTHLTFAPAEQSDPVNQLERAFGLCIKAEPAYERLLKALAKQQVSGATFIDRLQDAVAKQVLTQEEATLVEEYDNERFEALLTDDFDPAYLKGDFGVENTEQQLANTLTRQRVE
ncbi:Acyl-coenzyme A dehydrogenase [Carnimonas sp. R-84981]|uniref:acyl-CoA dehydrogenase n=1 Tax=Carnimonas bestiolae TaxID=3402172 RepID=UPI003EDB9815